MAPRREAAGPAHLGSPTGAAGALDPERYDRWFDTAWGRYAFGVELAAVLRAVGSPGGARVLDVGCGTGRFAAALEGLGSRLTGIDVDPAMVAAAARRVRGPVLVGDGTALPFADRSFDTTLAVTVCEFVDDPARLVAEMARVTRPGGRIVVATLNPCSPWGLSSPRRNHRRPWRDARFVPRRRLRRLGRAHGQATLEAVLYAPGSPPARGIGRAIGGALERAGGRLVPPLGAFQVLRVTR